MSFDPAADPERRRAKDRRRRNTVDTKYCLSCDAWFTNACPTCKGETEGAKAPSVSPEEKEFTDWLKKRSWKD